jgi:hypothetical protein
MQSRQVVAAHSRNQAATPNLGNNHQHPLPHMATKTSDGISSTKKKETITSGGNSGWAGPETAAMKRANAYKKYSIVNPAVLNSELFPSLSKHYLKSSTLRKQYE